MDIEGGGKYVQPQVQDEWMREHSSGTNGWTHQGPGWMDAQTRV